MLFKLILNLLLIGILFVLIVPLVVIRLLFKGGHTFKNQAHIQNYLFESMFSVMGCISKAKGNVTQSEIDLATATIERFNLHGEQKIKAQKSFRYGKEVDFPLDKVLQETKSNVKRRDLLQFFLDMQISTALADGSIHPKELEILKLVAQIFGFNESYLIRRIHMQEAAFRFQKSQYYHTNNNRYNYQSSYQQYSSQKELDDAYEILGIDKNSDAKTIKSAYRRLMNSYHPDKLTSKGLPPELMEEAKQKTQAIQGAYKLIKDKKGFK